MRTREHPTQPWLDVTPADAEPALSLPLPDPWRCDNPWCPARRITAKQVAAHAAAGCLACTGSARCLFLELAAQEPHLHGTRPDGSRG